MISIAGVPRGLAKFAAEARRKGATGAKVVPARSIVVDERVRLKCSVPLCDGFGRHLLCPPNVPSIDEFREVLGRYHHALLVQVEADYNSLDKSDKHLDGDVCSEIEKAVGVSDHEEMIARIVEEIEASAFKDGYYLAAGFGCNECALCRTCVGQGSAEPCRHPFRARPSMQAMGIDVVKTCEKAGMPVRLSSKHRVRWTGLVLLE